MRVAVPRDMRWTVASGEHYERNVTEWIQRLTLALGKPVIYDVGASYGFYSLRLADESAWVYAFEPVLQTFEILERNLRRNGVKNATPFKVALADHRGEVPINLYSSSGTNSFVWALPPDHPAKLIGREVVQVTTLDQFAQDNRLEPPGIIKLDVEGTELQAIRGGREVISRAKPFLILESRDEPWFDPGYSRDTLIGELLLQDYVVAGLSKSYDDFELYPRESFESAEVVNLLCIPRQRTQMVRRLGAVVERLAG
jgi:FkbM family methyltransferase